MKKLRFALFGFFIYFFFFIIIISLIGFLLLLYLGFNSEVFIIIYDFLIFFLKIFKKYAFICGIISTLTTCTQYLLFFLLFINYLKMVTTNLENLDK